jgi:hypothetical protein
MGSGQVQYGGFRIELNIRASSYTTAHALAEALLQRSQSFVELLNELESSGKILSERLKVFRIPLHLHQKLCSDVLALCDKKGIFNMTYQMGKNRAEKNMLGITRKESYMDVMNVLGLFGYVIQKRYSGC